MNEKSTYEESGRRINDSEMLESGFKDNPRALERLFELSIDMLCVADIDGYFRMINHAFEKTLGYTKTELLGTPFIRFVHPEDRELTVKAMGQLSRGEPVTYFENRYCCKGGSYKWLAWTAMPVPIEGLIYAVARDMTRRKLGEQALKNAVDELERRVDERTAELREANERLKQEIENHQQTAAAMRESEKKYRTILDSIEDGYYEVDLAGNFTYVNDAVCRSHGYSREELMKKNNRDYMDPEIAARIYKIFNEVYKTGNPVKITDYAIRPKDGSKQYRESSVSLIRDAKGRPIGFRGITRDVTARILAEKERDRLIADLKEALANIKTLKGLLPICAHCKKIRDDKGYWNQIEKYVRDHTDVAFSHGICPECAKTHYPEYNLYSDEEKTG